MRILAAREWRRRASAAAACPGGSGHGAGGNGSGPIGITKDLSNRFWTALVDGAMAARRSM
jgi:hypothetical protein